MNIAKCTNESLAKVTACLILSCHGKTNGIVSLDFLDENSLLGVVVFNISFLL